ncbi:intercellular adhesion molecule 1 isoform X2 [Alexandromys fortis]|uniref:intercellular adhesion molecule 1 isoform X2 n=1 Tax=Alexandromys fortis TaxID=100897 RepID=UPI002153804D|nr:intercellular adhesion molecule 1 isoform X2 [Microtus fortis]
MSDGLKGPVGAGGSGFDFVYLPGTEPQFTPRGDSRPRNYALVNQLTWRHDSRRPGAFSSERTFSSLTPSPSHTLPPTCLLLQFGNSWAMRASEAGPPLSARALSPSGNTEVLVQEGKARGFRESGPASTAPRYPVASDYKGPDAVQSLSLHPVLVTRTLLPALCPGLAMAPTLPLLLALVALVIPGPGGAQVSIHPIEAFLPMGASMQVNCSSSCTENLNLGLETQWPKREVESGLRWKLFELSDIEEDSKPLCFETCGSIQSSASATILLYSFPERVELGPLPTWQQVGKNLTLRCLVDGGTPRHQLSVILLRGEEVLYRQPVDVDPKNPKEITATVLVNRDDHEANFSCRTELDLTQHGLPLFTNVSMTRQLRAFDLPVTIPKLDTPDLLEVGTKQKVLCSLEGLFPASEAQISLELGGHTLTSKTTNHRDLVSAMALVEVTAELEGTQQLLCVLDLADQTLRAERILSIYSFPAPALTQSQPNVSEGSQVTVSCEASGGAQVVNLTDVQSGPPSPKVQYTLTATAQDNKRRFSCSAALDVAGQVLFKTRTLELQVLYGPYLNESDCPTNLFWKVGTWETLKCEARGNPPPTVNCSRKGDGALLPIRVMKSVTWAMNGTYVCHAESSRGIVTRDVFLTTQRPTLP